MSYRCCAASIEGAVQLIAANYLRHGFYWYVTGCIPQGKNPQQIDTKLLNKYEIDVSAWERARRRKAGLANAHYLRCGEWFIIMVSEGHHKIKQPSANGGERESLRDCRRQPIRLFDYTISYRRANTDSEAANGRWHAHVRIEPKRYRQLKAYFGQLAVHRTKEHLEREFQSLPYARYAPIRRQILNLARMVNAQRSQQGFDLVAYSRLSLRRLPVKVYDQPTNIDVGDKP